MNPRRGTAGASPVLDDEWLAEPLRQLRCLHRHVGCLRPERPRDSEQFRSKASLTLQP